MSDQQSATTPAPENRLGACVDLIKNVVARFQQFRPEDAAKQTEFEALYDDLLTLFGTVSAAAAVDHAAIILAKDLSAIRNDAMLASQKLRQDADAAALLPFRKGVAQ